MRTSIVGRILTVLIFVLVIGALSVGPAIAKNDKRGRGPQQRGWSDDRGRPDNRRWHDNRRWYDNRGRRVYRPYRYQPAPVYAPPPVIYAPLPSPGISIFFPPIHIR